MRLHVILRGGAESPPVGDGGGGGGSDADAPLPASAAAEDARREAQQRAQLPIGVEGGSHVMHWMMEQRQHWLTPPGGGAPGGDGGGEESGQAPKQKQKRVRGLSAEERLARRKRSLAESSEHTACGSHLVG